MVSNPKKTHEDLTQIVLEKLIAHGFRVFESRVGGKITFIIHDDVNRYLDLEVHDHSKRDKHSLFTGLKVDPRDNYFIILYVEGTDDCWIFPSEDAVKHSSSQYGNKIDIQIPTDPNDTSLDQFKNENGFSLLK